MRDVKWGATRFCTWPNNVSNLYKWFTEGIKNYMNVFADNAKMLGKLLMKVTKSLQVDLNILSTWGVTYDEFNVDK